MASKNFPPTPVNKQQDIEGKIRFDLFGKSIHAATFSMQETYEFIEDSNSSSAFIETFLKSPIITVDIKFQGMENAKWLTISETNGNYLIAELEKVEDDERQFIQKLLSTKAVKVLKDGKPVLKALRQNNYTIAPPYFDITLAGLVLDSDIGDVKGYVDVVAMCGRQLPANESYLNWNYGISKGHIKSVATDAKLVVDLMAKLRTMLVEHNLAKTAYLEFSCLPAIVELEIAGIGFDEAKWLKVEEQIRSELKALEDELMLSIGKVDFEEESQLLDAIKSVGIPVANISIQSLSALSEDTYPIIKLLKQYLSVKDLVKKYHRSFYIYLAKHDNRLFPTYNQIRANGRIYCQEPNIQQWPKRKDFRECVIAAEGKKLIDGDYSQIDLRSAAEVANDPVMIKAFQEGTDLHKLTASFVYGKPSEEITKDERQSAKVINFGLIYGMFAFGLKAKIQAECGISITEMQAEKFINRYFQSYKGIKHWQDSMINRAVSETRTLLGRRKLCKEDTPKSVIFNSPIQGTSADIMKRALSLLPERIKRIDGKIVCIIHDEIICEVPEEYAKEGEKILHDTMKQAGEFFLKNVPIVVETVITDSWAGK